MGRYGLVGEKLSHSFSPELHKQFGNDNYELIEVARDNIEAFFETHDFTAVNVTIPYKEIALKHCEADVSAREIGAVNTLVNRDGIVRGYNTDYLGFMYMLKRAEIELCGRKVAILGSGGTSKTVRYVCNILKADSVVVISRNAKTSDCVTYEDTEKYSDAQILINTTPVGMFPKVEECPVDITLFANLEAVVDVIYNPLRTELTAKAQKLGIKTTNGLPMLIAQGWYAEQLFMGKAIESQHDNVFCDEIEKCLSAVLNKNGNIVFIGMPGSGKTSVGKALADVLDRKFVDLDVLFSEHFGMSPEICINIYGQDDFRRKESEIVDIVSEYKGYVIATGGGCVKKSDNVRKLRRNGRIVFLDRALAELEIDGRPLSKGKGNLEKLYNERYGLYRAAMDIYVKVDASVSELADRIAQTI